MTSRRLLTWTAQAALLAAVAWFAARVLNRHWHELGETGLRLRPRPGWILLSAVVVWATYGLLIAAWRGVIRAWGEPLGPTQALRIWALSNLGRYLPGKVWSVAGLAVLARRAGVAGWAAVGSALVLQAVAVGSGVAVTAATVPNAASPLWLAAAAATAAGTVAALSAPRAVGWLNRIVPGGGLRPLGVSAVARATTVTAVSWAGYGVAFWCLARGLVGETALSLASAVGVFAAGYIVGLLAIFAPGGVVVREGVFVTLLTPSLGPGPALALSVASRLLLTVTELTAAGAGLLVPVPAAVRDAGTPD